MRAKLVVTEINTIMPKAASLLKCYFSRKRISGGINIPLEEGFSQINLTSSSAELVPCLP